MTAATSGTTKRDPVTRSRLVQDLRALGLAPGTCVLVHCSLSRIGLVIGGTRALIDALLEVLGPSDADDAGPFRRPVRALPLA